MRKKLLNVKRIGILAVVLVLFLAVGVAEEEITDASGQWKYILEDGGATITGYVEEPRGELVIPSEVDGYAVTGIGESAFEECEGITSVTIPAGVTSIDEYAFCGSDITIIIPAGVTHIADNAFDGSVVGFYVAKGSYAEQYAQENQIGYVLIDASWQWKYTPDWDDEDYKEGVAIIGYVVEPIGDLVFPCELDGYPVTGIGVWYAITTDAVVGFEGCAELVSVTIPDGVTCIHDCAFRRCNSLTSVTIPDSVTYIGSDEAFEGCDKLVLSVTKGSVAEEYAQENDIPYVYAVE
jgi:hypothetical protein